MIDIDSNYKKIKQNYLAINAENRFIILDLFCGAGGAAYGLSQVWPQARIIGVDIEWQPHYPYEFHCGDAMTLGLDKLQGINLIWASPPCQFYSKSLLNRLKHKAKHPDYIKRLRNMLLKSGFPYVIENVECAPLLYKFMLCGEMFGLRTTRHRFFESSYRIKPPDHPKHKGSVIKKDGSGYYYPVYGNSLGVAHWPEAMGIYWMNRKELSQAVPPAYSKYIGQQIKLQLGG